MEGTVAKIDEQSSMKQRLRFYVLRLISARLPSLRQNNK